MREERKNIKALTRVQALEKPQTGFLQPSYASYEFDIEDEDNHLREYLRAARKHFWLIAGITLLVTALAWVSASRKPNIYQAQSRVQVDLESNPALSSEKNGSLIINSPINDPAYFNTQLQNLGSANLLRRVVKTLDLENNQSFIGGPQNQTSSIWQRIPKALGGGSKAREEVKKPAAGEVPVANSLSPATPRDDLAEAKRLAPFVAAIQAGLRIDPVKETRTGSWTKETRLIDISFTHTDPQLAAKIVNGVAEAFVNANLEKKTETNASAGNFLQKRVADLQGQIRNGEERLINYAKNHQILSLDASQNTVVDRLANLNRQLLEAENARKEAEAAYRAAQAPGAASALAEQGGKDMTEAQTKLAALRERYAQLRVENTEEWPEVKEVKQQIAVLEKEIMEARTRAASIVMTNLETRYRQSYEREKALRAAFEQQRAETVNQNEAAINYRIIQQEIETNKQLLDQILQRSKENDVVLAGTPNNISVVDYALAPEAPVGPQRTRTVLTAFVLSLAFGIGLAILIEYLNDSIRSTEDVERIIRLPALASIPAIGALSKRRLIGSGTLRTRNGNKGAAELLLQADSRSPLAEAYRHLRTSVLLSTAGHAPKSLLVTSSVPAEGKTTTAVNTAISLAQTGASVLLIDADMRRPRLQSIFDTPNSRGLSTILSNTFNELELINTIIQHEETNLNLLTSGPIPPNPAELIGSDQMRDLITVLSDAFDHIVIDSPPIGSFTDGVLAGSIVDGVILVVHSGKTPRGVVRRSRQILQEVGAKIFGVVLNRVDLRSHDNYYLRYYKYDQKDSDAQSEQLASGTQG